MNRGDEGVTDMEPQNIHDEVLFQGYKSLPRNDTGLNEAPTPARGNGQSTRWFVEGVVGVVKFHRTTALSRHARHINPCS